MLNKLISKVKGLFIKDNIITEDIKNEIVEVNTKTKELNLFDIVKSEKNRENHTCIDLVLNLKKQLDIDMLDYVTNHVKLENTKKEYIINNEDDLYIFYLENNDNGLLPNKKLTGKRTNLHIEKVRRLNEKLKSKNLIFTKGKSIFLVKKEESINE